MSRFCLGFDEIWTDDVADGIGDEDCRCHEGFLGCAGDVGHSGDDYQRDGGAEEAD